MKKLLNKIRRKAPAEGESSRITADTLAEHREKILAGGRRFKYPVQYARHKLVFNAIIIGVAAIALLVTVLWWQLYIVQNTSDFMYRVTKVVPVPVAEIDGQQVRYSDYLMKYRSSVHYLEEKEQVNLGTEDGKRQADFVKRQAMEDALADAYATKIARENNIVISDEELEAYLKSQRRSADGEVSEITYNTVIEDYYGWSPDEYRYAMKQKLLRQKVAYEVDTTTQPTIDAVLGRIKNGETNLKKVAEAVNKGTETQTIYHGPTWVPKTNQDGGIATAAAGLKKGQISDAIRSTAGDGYFVIKLVDSNESEVRYESIQAPLTTFNKNLEVALKGEMIKRYITVPEIEGVE